VGRADEGAEVLRVHRQVVRALEERPLTVDRWIGRLGEWVGILTPRFSDSVMYRYDQQRPDSAAARGERT
jgi:hypothetical protein